MARQFTETSFREWKHSRLTQAYLQYLRDQVDRLKDQWAEGQEMDSRHQTKALLMGELASLEWADYAAFYGLPEGETSDER
jgi:hypothetical protein